MKTRRIHGQSFKDVAEGHTKEQCGQEAAQEDADIPEPLPGVIGHLSPEFQGYTADDQSKQEQEQGGIEVAEHEGIRRGEGGEGGPSRSDEPDLVAVPYGSYNSDHGLLFILIFRQEIVEHAGTEHEAVEHEIHGPEDTP